MKLGFFTSHSFFFLELDFFLVLRFFLFDLFNHSLHRARLVFSRWSSAASLAFHRDTHVHAV